MSDLYFKHSRSAHRQAIKQLTIAIGFPVSIWIMMEIFAKGKVPEEQVMYIYGVSILVSIFIIFIFVLPKLRTKGIFEFMVTNQSVKCNYPGKESYSINTDDIKRILQIKHATGNLYVDELIEDKDGKVYSIPKEYDLNISNAINAILKANPSIVRENEVKY